MCRVTAKVLICAALAFTPATAWGRPFQPAVYEAGERAVAYLRSLQNSDGSWDEFNYSSAPSITAMVTLSLLNVGLPAGDPMLRRALAYLFTMRRADGSFASTFTVNRNKVTSLGVLVMVAADTSVDRSMYRDEVAAAMQYLQNAQGGDGGWSCGNVQISDIIATHHALLALHYACHYLGYEKDTTWAAAAGFLRAAQSADGGYGLRADSPHSTDAMTGAALLSLLLCECEENNTYSEAALSWLAQQYRGDWTQRVASDVHTYYCGWTVSGALQGAGCRLLPGMSTKGDDYVQDLCVDFIVGTQKSGGYWLGEADDNAQYALSTAFALSILAAHSGDIMRRGEYLLRIQLEAAQCSARLWDYEGRYTGEGFAAAAELQIGEYRRNPEGAVIELIRNADSDASFTPGSYHLQVSCEGQSADYLLSVTLLERRGTGGEETVLSGPLILSGQISAEMGEWALDFAVLWAAGPTLVVQGRVNPAPALALSPMTLEIIPENGVAPQVSLYLHELGGVNDITSLVLSVTDLLGWNNGCVVDNDRVVFSDVGGMIHSGSSRETIVSVTLPAGFSEGYYDGRLLVDTGNAGCRSIPLRIISPEWASRFYVYPPYVTFNAAEEVRMQIVASNLPPGVRSIDLDVEYDSAVLGLRDVDANAALVQGWSGPQLAASRICLRDIALTNNTVTEGTLASFTFDWVSKPASDTAHLVSFSAVRMLTETGDTLAVPPHRLESTGYVCGIHPYTLCDFNSDGSIDFDDLMILALGWIHQDLHCDVGPLMAGSSITQPIPIRDGVVDLEDLLVFAHRWDMHHTMRLPKPSSLFARHSAALSAEPYLSIIGDQPAVGDTVLLILGLESPRRLLGARCNILYDAEKVDYLGAKGKEMRSPDPNGCIAIPPFVKARAGSVDLEYACISPHSAPGELAQLGFLVKNPGLLTFRLDHVELRDFNNFALTPAEQSVASTVASPQHCFQLLQNAPNPFNQRTIFSFSLSQPQSVRLEIFNSLGRRVATLIDRRLVAGNHELSWNGSDHTGVQLPSGLYFYRLKNGASTATRKLTIIR